MTVKTYQHFHLTEQLTFTRYHLHSFQQTLQVESSSRWYTSTEAGQWPVFAVTGSFSVEARPAGYSRRRPEWRSMRLNDRHIWGLYMKYVNVRWTADKLDRKNKWRETCREKFLLHKKRGVLLGKLKHYQYECLNNGKIRCTGHISQHDVSQCMH